MSNSNTTNDAFEALLHEKGIYKIYLKVIRKLGYKDYSRANLESYLLNEELNEEQIEFILEALSERDILNDQRFVIELITRGVSKGYGRLRIIESLSKYQFDQMDIDQGLVLLTHDAEIEAGVELVQKNIRTLNSSKYEQITKAKRKLLSYGYSTELMHQIIARIDFSQSEEEEQIALSQCINKANRLYQNKEDKIRRQKVIEYCQKKGYRYDRIIACIEELERKESYD